MIILRTFSEGEEKKSHTGAKIAGGLAAVGTTAAVLATKGKLGVGAQKSMGSILGRAGNKLNSTTLQKIGTNAYGNAANAERAAKGLSAPLLLN